MGSSVCTGGPSGCVSYSFKVYFTTRGMARAEQLEERKLSFLSSASFRSATSYASFRSFKSIKSNKSLNSRASFKSVVSRDDGSNYYSCHDSISTRTGIVNEGYVDNLSFYSINDSEVPSIAACAPNPRQRSISNCFGEAPSETFTKEIEEESEVLKVGKTVKYLTYLAVLIAAVAVAGSATVSSLVPSLTPWMVLVYRSILQLVISLPMILGTRSNILGPAGFRWRIYLTGLLTSFLLLSLYLSITSLPARIVASIIITRQCHEVHFSVLLLWSALGSLLIGCIGLYSFGNEELLNEMGRDGRDIPDVTNDALQDTTSESGVASIKMFKGPTEWLVATLVAFLGIFVNVVILKALKYLKPGKVMLLKAAELVAGYVLHFCNDGGYSRRSTLA